MKWVAFHHIIVHQQCIIFCLEYVYIVWTEQLKIYLGIFILILLEIRCRPFMQWSKDSIQFLKYHLVLFCKILFLWKIYFWSGAFLGTGLYFLVIMNIIFFKHWPLDKDGNLQGFNWRNLMGTWLYSITCWHTLLAFPIITKYFGKTLICTNLFLLLFSKLSTVLAQKLLNF